MKCGAYFEEVFDQTKYIMEYSQSSFIPLKSIIDCIKKNLKKNEDFATVVLDIEFTRDENIEYYDSLL